VFWCGGTWYLHGSWYVVAIFVGKVSRADGSLLGMYALRERRQHVTQEDFEFAVAKVRMTKTCGEKVLTVCLM